MIKEKVKKVLSRIQAFIKCKKLKDIKYSSFNDKSICHIKSESNYRPFKNREECWQEMHNHSDFSWVINKYTERCSHITSVCSTMILLPDDLMCSYEMAFKRYKFLDGTPFGIKDN